MSANRPAIDELRAKGLPGGARYVTYTQARAWDSELSLCGVCGTVVWATALHDQRHSQGK